MQMVVHEQPSKSYFRLRLFFEITSWSLKKLEEIQNVTAIEEKNELKK
jgi:hypothetical protein